MMLAMAESPASLTDADRERQHVEFLLAAAQQHQEYSRVYLPRLFGNDPALRQLDLRGTHLSDLSVVSLMDALRCNTIVTSLDLSENSISAEGAAAIGQLLETNTTLNHINLGNNQLDDAAVQELIASLWHNHTLNLINLEGNTYLSAEAAAELYAAVKLNAQPPMLKRILFTLHHTDLAGGLREIDLSSTVDGSTSMAQPMYYLDDFSAQALALGLRTNVTVVVVNLRNNRIGDDGAKHLAWMLEVNSKLDEIDLFGNLVAAAGCMAFMDVIMDYNNCLTLLDLRGNCVADSLLIELEWALTLNRQPLNLKKFLPAIQENDPNLNTLRFDEHLSQRFYDDVSVRLLADALRHNTCVTALELPNNLVTEVGAHFLADLLRINSSLRHLDLMNNQVAGGIRWLSNALKDNCTLTFISLAGNRIEDVDAEPFAEMLMENRGLVHVDLQRNSIRHSAGSFARAFGCNSVLQQLRLEGNQLDPMHMYHIQQRLLLNNLSRSIQEAVHRIKTDPNMTVVDLTFDPTVHQVPVDDTSISQITLALTSNFTVKSLILSENDLTAEGVRSICDMLRKNVHTLTHLDLSRNKDISPEAADDLAAVFAYHRSLTSLDVSYNNLGNEGVHILMRRAEDSPTLKVLNVEGCRCSRSTFDRAEIATLANRHAPQLKERMLAINDSKLKPEVVDLSEYAGFASLHDEKHNSDGAAVLVAKTLMNCSFFHTFQFRRNRLGDEGCCTFAKLFTHHCSATALDFSENCITDHGAATLVELVKARQDVVSIMVDKNPITAELLSQLSKYLAINRLPSYFRELLLTVESNTPSLTTIDLSTVVSHQMGDEEAVYLAKAISENSHTTSINVANHHLGIKGVTALCGALKGNTMVHTLCLNNNGLSGHAPATALADLLRHNTVLHTLGLRANEISKEGAMDLIGALEVNDTLLKLDLRDNGLPAETMVLVDVAIQLNKEPIFKRVLPEVKANKVTDLDLSARRYDDRLLQPLALAVAENTSLTALHLQHNMIQDAGAEMLATAIRHHPSLRHLNLAHNAITEVGAASLASALEVNQALKWLILDRNRIPPTGVRLFRGPLQKNETLIEMTFGGNPDFDQHLAEEVACMCINPQPMLKSLLKSLAECSTQLTVLDFSRGQLNPVPKGGPLVDEVTLKATCTHNDVTCILMRRPLEYNNVLHTLNLSNGHITDRGVSVLCEALMLNRTVVSLSLANNELTSQSAKTVADVLLCNPILIDVNLRSNRIEEDGAEVLLGALSVNYTCRRLNLDLNPVSDVTLQHLGYAVTLNNQPRTLKDAIQQLRQGEAEVQVIRHDPTVDVVPYDDVSCQLISDLLKENCTVTEVDVQQGRVTDVGAFTLASMLFVNTTLRSLNLAHNKLADCCLSFTNALMANHTLQHLDLRGNRIPEPDHHQIMTLLALNWHPLQMKPIVHRFMTQDRTQTAIEVHGITVANVHNQVMDTSNDVPWVPEAFLDPHPQGRLIYMTDPAVKILAEFLKTDVYCERVSLAHNRVSNMGAIYLAEVLRINDCTLTYLDLSDNMVEDEGAVQLARAVVAHRKLTELNLSRNLVGPVGAAALLATAKVSSLLRYLPLTGNPIGHDIAADIDLYVSLNRKHPNFKSLMMRCIHNDPTLVSIDMSEFQGRGCFDGECTRLMQRALRRHTHLTRLVLRFNWLIDDDVPHLAAIVDGSFSLLTLDVSNNQLSNIGPLTDVLKANAILRTLNLAHNRLRPADAQKIGDMLRQNCVLTDLDVSGNPMGDVGAIHIIEAVKFNGGLTTLNLDGMNLPQKLLDSAEMALRVDLSKQVVFC